MALERRKRIGIRLIKGALEALSRRIHQKVKKCGDHAFVSRHEILGQVTEEYLELSDAVKTDKSRFKRHIRDELFDIAIAAIWGILSIDTDSVDW